MLARVASVVLLIVLAAPLLAAAQQSSMSQPSDLEMQLKRRRTVVLPLPPQQAVMQDVERVTEQVTARAREDQLIRERERRLSRPELNSTISNAIAARNALRALGR